MMHTTTGKNSHYKLTYCIALVALLCASPTDAQQPVQNEKISGVEVYVSSRDGDRLTKKKNATFDNDTKSSLPLITVDEKKTYQTIEGFGATFNEAGMICLNSLSSAEKEKVLRSLFDSASGSGFTLMKSPIAACDFASAGPWYSYNETPDDTLMTHFSIERDLGPNGLVTYIKAASRYGKFRIESPMDFAPDWMYYGFNKGEKNIQPKYYKALARYYSKYLQSYAVNGVHIDYLNLFNEADNEWYSNVTYRVIADLIKNYVIPQLASDGVSIRLQLGETSTRPEAIKKFPAILDDAELRRHVNSLTVHGYDWDRFSTLMELHQKFPGLPIWQTEVCYALPNNVPPNGPTRLPLYDFSDGEFWGNMIINDLKNWASAWIYWNMILDENGGPWLVSVEHGDPDNNKQHPVVIINRNTHKVSYTGLYFYLTHFSKFVRPGAVRIETSGGSNKLNFVGFENIDHSIVLNVINNGEPSDCEIRWHNKTFVQKLPAHSMATFKWYGSPGNH
jgi:glucosylceramidase